MEHYECLIWLFLPLSLLEFVYLLTGISPLHFLVISLFNFRLSPVSVILQYLSISTLMM